MAEQTLKPGWTRVSFGNVVKLNTDRCADPAAAGIERYVGLEHIEPEDLRIRRWGLVEEGTTFTNRFRPGQVLFGKRRAYQRKVAVADFEGVCSSDIYVFEPKDDRLLPELLPFLCQTEAFYAHAVGTSAGSLSPRTNWTQLANYEFALPPLEEQRRMAEVVRGSLEALYAVQGALESLKSLRFSGINTLCDHEEGCLVALGDVCEMQNGRAFPGDTYGKSGAARLLRPGNLGSSGYLDWNEEKTVFLPDKYIAEASDYVIDYNDVVINLTAQSLEDGFMGRVCLARAGDHSLLNQRIGRFVFISQAIHPQFAYRIMQTNRFQQHCVSMCEGTKVKHLYWRHLSPFQLRLPSLEKQQQVADALMEIDIAHDRLLSRGGKQKQLHDRILNSALVG
jgi:type I restriction enzyme S subunit